VCTFESLGVLASSQIKDRKNLDTIDLWEWLFVGVVITKECTIDVQHERAVPAAVWMFPQPSESEDGPCWEIMEWVLWQLVQQTRAWSGIDS